MPVKKAEVEGERKRLIVEELDKNQPTVEATLPQDIASTQEPPQDTKPPTAETIQEPPDKPNEVPIIQKPAAEPPNGKANINPFWIIGPGVVLLGALLGGIVVYQKGINKVQPKATPTSAIENTPQATPTATPEVKANLTEFPVKVLNGSGIAGEAGKAQNLLETAGFKVSSVGNAATYGFTKTIIEAKGDVGESFTNQLKASLSKNYSVEEEVKSLPASSKVEVVVTVGKGKS